MKKSPTRKPRNPSPGRKVEKTETVTVRRTTRSRSRSRGRAREEVKSAPSKSKRSPARSPIISKPSNSVKKIEKIEKERPKTPSVEKEEAVRNSLSRFDEMKTEAVVTLRRSARRVFSHKEAEIVEEVNNLLKDNNLDPKDLETKEYPREDKQKEFAGLPGVILLIPLLPAIVILLHLACTRANCTMKGFVIPTSWRKYFDLEVTYYYIGFQLFQLILSSLPIGFHAHSTSGKYVTLPYRCNGFISGAVTLGGLYGLHRAGWLDPKVVLDRSLQMCIVAALFALLLSLGLHLFSTPTSYRSSLYDFWVGRQVSPRFKSLDLKISLIRASLISVIAHNCILLYVEWQGKTAYSQFFTSAAVAAILQIVYTLDFLVFESSYLDSFTIRHEATGYMLIMSLALYPFFMAVLPKYLYYNKVSNSIYVMGAVIFFYCLGHLLFRMSNAQKSSFKRISYPLHMSGVEVIEGVDGRRLLAGGLWGWVRHPNHLGAAVLSASLSGLVTGGTLHWAPLAPPLLTVLALAHRAKRDSALCAQRYGPAWARYASKVKYDLLPRVF